MSRKFPRESRSETKEKNTIPELWEKQAVHRVGGAKRGLIIAVQDGTEFHVHGKEKALEIGVGEVVAYDDSVPLALDENIREQAIVGVSKAYGCWVTYELNLANLP
eukprot:scaffold4150_cov117-Cylindrotheca_fusiformis.AAC.9